MYADRLAVQEDQHVFLRMQFVARHQRGIFHAEVNRELEQRLLISVRCDMRSQGKIFHETAALTLWRIRRTDHTPLAWLESTRTTDLARFFELAVDACHHAQRRDVRQARQDLRNTLTLHLESL